MTATARIPAGATPAHVRRRPMLFGAALGIVYVVWGSTYLAIRIMVGEVPPLVGAGIRFLTAGLPVVGLSWAFGSWYQPRFRLPGDPFVVAVYEMLIGGGCSRSSAWPVKKGFTRWTIRPARGWPPLPSS